MSEMELERLDNEIDDAVLERICALDGHVRDVQKQVGVRELQAIIDRDDASDRIMHLLESLADNESDGSDDSLPSSTFFSSQDYSNLNIDEKDPDWLALESDTLKPDPNPYARMCEKFGQEFLDKAGLSAIDFATEDLLANPFDEEEHGLPVPKSIHEITDPNELKDKLLQIPIIENIIKLIQKICILLKIRNRPYDWGRNARFEQLQPNGDWRVWMIMAGRGFGKTRTGAETIRKWVDEGTCKRIALIGASESEVRDVMIEGESGLLSVFPPDDRPVYEPSKRRITFANGAIATIFSSENPEQLRGPQFDGAWVDELAKFRNDEEVWTQLNLSLRLGENPRVIITTTPRPTDLMKQLLNDQIRERVHLTRGSTFDNAQNLSKHFLNYVKHKYESTQMGRQELEGEMLDQQEGALFPLDLMAKTPIRQQQIPELKRIVVAIDPAVTSSLKSDETGIIIAGADYQGKAYILGDVSGRYRPQEWANKALAAYDHYQADAIVAEVNQGGDMVSDIIRSVRSEVAIKQVYASRGKATRAEPVVALYEQGRVKHKRCDTLKTLEDQMLGYVPGISKKSPDRLDALVWAITELLIQKESPPQELRLLGRL